MKTSNTPRRFALFTGAFVIQHCRFVSRIILIGCLALLSSSLLLAQGGSLTPPGAPAPTMKALDEVEPRINLSNAPASAVTTSNASYHFIITQPGSYYLSANLGVTKPNGIQINVDGVTLDLNGFQISRSSGTGGNGIEIPATSHRAAVRNGSIKGFSSGVRSLSAGSDFARACAFRDLSVSNCFAYGIYAGEASVLESCRAHDNSGTAGIAALAGSTLQQCTAIGNAGTYGIYADRGSTLSHCAATSNTTFYSIFASDGSTLSHCAAADNTGAYGIYASSGSTATHCAATGNTMSSYAIYIGAHGTLTHSSVYINTSSASTSAGIGTGSVCNVSHCTSGANSSTAVTLTPTTGMGFDMGASNLIESCVAYLNAGDGINLLFDSIARGNTCDSNGTGAGDGAGIHSTSSDNRIEGNNVTDNDRGIDVDSIGSLIIKNTASGNVSNYEIAANNVFGEIVNRIAPASAAVSGNSAASSAGTTDPWANFAY